jgi:hypothetical protein
MGATDGVLAVGAIVAPHAAKAMSAVRGGLAVHAMRTAVAVMAGLAEHTVHRTSASFTAKTSRILLCCAEFTLQANQFGVELGSIHGPALYSETQQSQHDL